jgi:ATP-dependent DNA helicase RecQ
VQRKVLRAVERLVGARRQELIPFSPNRLAIGDEIDQPSLLHALHELNRLEAFTYLPPFRGRAIRMIRRDLPFDKLGIDFAALERRKASEMDKLNQIVSFALSGSCRQREILRYFGEKNPALCGHCDNCGRQPIGAVKTSDTRQIPSDKSLEAVRMVLSGVARTEARFACGKNLIAQMLCGSKNEKVKKFGLDRLSTFGLLKHLKQAEVVTLVEALISIGCLEQEEVDKFRPVVKLTEFGREVMRAKTQLQNPLPISMDLFRKIHGEANIVSESPAPDTTPVPAVSRKTDGDLLSALKRWRLDIADEAGIPAYCILHNTALNELVARRPQSAAELLEIKGIGPAKSKQFGQSLLEIVAEYAGC